MFRLTRGRIGWRGAYFKNSSTKYIYFILFITRIIAYIFFILSSLFLWDSCRFAMCTCLQIPYLVLHIRIVNVTQRNECLLNGLRRCPTEYVMRSTCLIICSRFTTATKWLLSHHRSRGLVIDIEISRSWFKFFQSAVNKISALCKCYCIKRRLYKISPHLCYLLILTINSTSQCKRRCCINQIHCIIQISVFVYINC